MRGDCEHALCKPYACVCRKTQKGETFEGILLSTTNKMQSFTIFFIIVNAVRVSGGFSTHHQELKNCTHSIWYGPGWLAATASVVAR
jgi:hypothetical protein